MGGFNSVTTLETIVFADNASFDGTERGGALSLDGQLWIGSTTGRHVRKGTLTAGTGVSITNGPGTITIGLAGGGVAVETLSDDVGTIVTPLGNNIQLIGHVVEAGATKFSTVTAGTNLLNINPMSASRWIVDPLGFNGTHTTIASALASATSGDTIFLLPGTYTENLTLKDGVNISAYDSDGLLPIIGSGSNSFTANVTILGTLSASFSNGRVSLCGIALKTDGATSINLSGSGTIINLINCSLYANDATGMTVTNGGISCFYSTFRSSSTSQLFSVGPGQIDFDHCSIILSSSATASTISSNGVGIRNCYTIDLNITASSTGLVVAFNSNFSYSGNTILTMSGTGSSTFFNCNVESFAASAFSIGSGTTLTIENCSINSSNTNVITGAGTLNYANLSFTGSSRGVNVTTQVPLATGPIIANQDGLVATPSYSFKSDLTTGMWLGTGKLRFSVGGVDLLNFDGSNLSLNSANTFIQKITMQSGLVSSLTTPGAYPYTTLATDYIILVDTSAARTINLIGSPTTGQTYRIKDNTGSAGANNITITPAAGNIDNAASYVISTNLASVDVVYNGTQWNVL